MSRDFVKANNPVIKKELEDLWDEIDSVAGDAEGYADDAVEALQGDTTSTVADVEDALATVSAKAIVGAPVNAVAAKATLTLLGVVVHGEEIVVGDDTYQFAADTNISVTPGNIPVLIEASTTKSNGALTMVAQPGATETVVIGSVGSEVTYTFVGSNPVAGEVDVGASAAEAQANLVAAINGTDGVNTAHTEVSASAFNANVSTITALIGGVASDAITTTDTLVGAGDGFAAGTLANGADCTAANAVTAVVTASIAATEAVTVTDGANDTLVFTADVKGLAAESILTSTDCANGTFDVAHLEGGVDGTLGDAGTLRVVSGRLHVAFAANTISDANWQSCVIS